MLIYLYLRHLVRHDFLSNWLAETMARYIIDMILQLYIAFLCCGELN